MSFTAALAWPRRHITVDRTTLEMGALFAFVMGVTGWLALLTGPTAAQEVAVPATFGEGAQGQATAAGAWALAEIVLAGLLVASIFLYRRLPEFYQDLLLMNITVAVVLLVGATYGYWMAPVFVAAYTGYKLTDRAGVWWVINDALGIAVAIVIGLVLGLLFGVAGMAVALVALTAYDHLFANKKTWMFTLGKAVMELRLPLIIYRPTTLRFQWSEIVDSLSDAEAGADTDAMDDASWGIGTGDFALPAGFVAAVATAQGGVVATFGPIAVALVIGGILVACARLRFEMMTQGSGAGLPALSVGALTPYAALMLVGVVV